MRGFGANLIIPGVLLWCFGGVRSNFSDNDADVRYPNILLERVAFGSCNKQTKLAEQNETWAAVDAYGPQLWLWTG